MKNNKTLQVLNTLGACEPAQEWVRKQHQSPEVLYNRCTNASWLLWLAGAAKIQQKTIALVAVEIAESVLYLFPKDETQPRDCLKVARLHLQGKASIAEVEQARQECWIGNSRSADTRAGTAARAEAAAAATDAAATLTDAAATVTAALAAAAADATAAADAADAADAGSAAGSSFAAYQKQNQVNLQIIRKHIPYRAIARAIAKLPPC